MRKYECLDIVASEIVDEALDAVIAKFADFVTNNGGKVEDATKIGLKKLAYPIKFKREGFYVLMNYEAEGNLPKDMEKLMNITDGILRSMSIAK